MKTILILILTSRILFSSPEKIYGQTFTVGPNPFQDELTVHVETNDTTTIEVAIHDLTGKIIASQKTSNDKKFLFETTNLPIGKYFVRVIQNEETLGTRHVFKL